MRDEMRITEDADHGGCGLRRSLPHEDHRHQDVHPGLGSDLIAEELLKRPATHYPGMR
jgi:hypothetical protein